MRRERWLIFTFVPALMLLNAFVVLNYTGLSYEPFSWKAFAQPYGDGAECDDPADCISGNCVDDFCCNTPCTEPNEICDQPGNEGLCVALQEAPAPTLSGIGLLVASGLLAGIGSLGLLRRRRKDG
jgi:hypothetical protein